MWSLLNYHNFITLHFIRLKSMFANLLRGKFACRHKLSLLHNTITIVWLNHDFYYVWRRNDNILSFFKSKNKKLWLCYVVFSLVFISGLLISLPRSVSSNNFIFANYHIIETYLQLYITYKGVFCNLLSSLSTLPSNSLSVSTH